MAEAARVSLKGESAEPWQKTETTLPSAYLQEEERFNILSGGIVTTGIIEAGPQDRWITESGEYLVYLGAQEPSVGQLLTEIRDLRNQVAAAARRLELLESGGAPPDVIVLREISREQAKQEVASFFQEHPGSYPSDAAIALRLDAALVRDLSLELMNEGLLGEA